MLVLSNTARVSLRQIKFRFTLECVRWKGKKRVNKPQNGERRKEIELTLSLQYNTILYGHSPAGAFGYNATFVAAEYCGMTNEP